MPTSSPVIRGVFVCIIFMGVLFLSSTSFIRSGKGEQLHKVDGELNSPLMGDITPTPTNTPQIPVYFPVVKNNIGVLYSEVIVANGQGFDHCKPLSIDGMQTWWDNSPYSTINIYLGGISALCPFDQLDLNWYSQVAQQGWSFILTWAGPQAPKGCPEACKFRYPMSLNPNIAYLEGKVEAFAAVDKANSLGFNGQLVIYYDVESYSGADDESRIAVAAFLRGWVEQLHALGHKAGAYGAACTSYVVDWAFNIPSPDNVWIAQWSKNYEYDPDASVWNTTCIDDPNAPPIFWTDHQRLKQYTGPHNESWGGVVEKIDSNVLDGQVVSLLNQPAAQNPETSILKESSREVILNRGKQIRATQLLSPREGWVLNGDHLYWTANGGSSWQDISTKLEEGHHILAFTFLDSSRGWIVLQEYAADNFGSLSIVKTEDGGLTWQKVSILIDNPDEVDEIESAFIEFIDPQTGWISFKLHSSSNFSFGRLLATEDGGSTWQERNIPLGEPVVFQDEKRGWVSGGPLEQTYTTKDGGGSWSLSEAPLEKQSLGLENPPGFLPGIEGHSTSVELPTGLVALDMLDMQQGWAVVHNGSCSGYKPRAGETVPPRIPPLQCESSSQLLTTADSGISWRDITPP
jgi:hypothetical protein